MSVKQVAARECKRRGRTEQSAEGLERFRVPLLVAVEEAVHRLATLWHIDSMTFTPRTR